MKLILSSCDFCNSTSAKFIIDNVCKSVSKSKVLYFPNERVTPKKKRVANTTSFERLNHGIIRNIRGKC